MISDVLSAIPGGLTYHEGTNANIDVKLEHVGMNINGDIVLYDTRDDTLSPDESSSLLRQRGLIYIQQPSLSNTKPTDHARNTASRVFPPR
jgi:hypothetical protein